MKNWKFRASHKWKKSLLLYTSIFIFRADLDTRVKWRFQNRPLRPNKIKEKTSGRVTIDATDALHIKDLRVTDAGEYTCSLYDVEIGLIRLKGKILIYKYFMNELFIIDYISLIAHRFIIVIVVYWRGVLRVFLSK